ncbi:MAG TPA: hypothetical protein VMU65_05670 [Candidatus Saccharimonadales bacterium]|nr:hypothetical protein [Candidatus Saccharimonadales bacterium]
MSISRRPTPVSAVVRGLVAAAVGTAAMDLYWYFRYRASGGTSGPLQWEFGGEPDWEKVSAPAKVGKRLFEGFTQRSLSERWAVLTNNVMHWGYGVGWGVAYGIVAGSVPQRRVAYGLALGPAVWLFGYAVLPLGGYYKPIWEYDARTLGIDLGGHLIYGTATAAAYRALP